MGRFAITERRPSRYPCLEFHLPKRGSYARFTSAPETLTNDFFVNLLDMKYKWKATFTGMGRAAPR